MIRYFSNFAALFLTISVLLLPQAGNAFVDMIASGIYGGDLIYESDPMAHSIVRIIDSDGHCSGVIITQNKILTARHCITTPSHLIKVRFGTGNSGSKFKWANVTRVSVMENETWGFKCQSPHGDPRCTQTDVAIVTIDGVIPKGYRPLQIYSNPAPDNVQFCAYGYGQTTSKEGESGGSLKDILSLTTPPFNSIVQSFSVDAENGLSHGIRPGDSGGPWVANFSGQYLIIGLNSSMSEQISRGAKGVKFTAAYSPDLSAPQIKAFILEQAGISY